MKFAIAREALLKPLNLVAGVVERRHTLPILANVLVAVRGTELSLTGTDLEVELVGRVALENPGVEGEITVPARKLVDICKSLPEGSVIDFAVDEGRVVVKSGRSRYVLSTLPATDFPNVEDSTGAVEFSLSQAQLKRLIDRTAFSMAQQDVRYYLNGMLWEVTPERLRTVATDGHRLGMCTLDTALPVANAQQAILPRKGVIELGRLLEGDGEVKIQLGSNHLRAVTAAFTFTSKLVDGRFPDYDRVLPRGTKRLVLAERDELKQALARAAILSNEKFRGIRLILSDSNLRILANNPEQEEAEEQVAVDYTGEEIEIGFNVNYLLDVLGVIKTERVQFSFTDSNSSALIEEAAENGDSLYVVMPMRL